MGVTETSDSILFLQLARHDRVILKYNTNEGGEACMNFIPVFKKLSDDPHYKNIAFLVINADTNPMAKKRILDKSEPVLTIYFKGKLVASKHVSTREGVKNLLEELLNK
ncbi:MAG: hypothetical protein ACXVC6_11450 [Bacteroidia bacterium]